MGQNSRRDHCSKAIGEAIVGLRKRQVEKRNRHIGFLSYRSTRIQTHVMAFAGSYLKIQNKKGGIE